MANTTASVASVKRNREIDFLRGIAILLVIFFHDRTIPFLNRTGWMGVDLFFVLSGFLVSGLLFKEYDRYRKVNAKQFLIRRGFKIYPVFYIFLVISVLLAKTVDHNFEGKKLLFEAAFLRNYGPGMWGHTWSLCVEEHFYFFLAFSMYLFARYKQIENKKLINGFFILIMVGCLANRIIFPYIIPLYKKSAWLTHVQTHFRIDSLSFGVLIAYNRYYNKEKFNAFFQKTQSYLLPLAITIMLPVMIMAPEDPAKTGSNFFMRSFGYVTLYLGFGMILIYFISKQNINALLDKYVSAPLANLMAHIGLYSYSIYVFHTMIRKYIVLNISVNPYLQTVIFVVLAVLTGMFIGKYVEVYFLRIRDKYFPSRSSGTSSDESGNGQVKLVTEVTKEKI